MGPYIIKPRRRAAGGDTSSSTSTAWALLQFLVSGVSPATYPNRVRKGSLLLCRTGFENSGPITLTDNAGNVWNSIQEASFGSPNVFLQQLHFTVSNSAFLGLQVTQAGGSPFFGMILTEWFGNSAAPLQTSGKQTNGVTNPFAGVTIPTTKIGELIYVSFDSVNHDSVPQPPIITIPGSPHEGYFVTGAPGNYTPQATSVLGGGWSEIAASFFHS